MNIYHVKMPMIIGVLNKITTKYLVMNDIYIKIKKYNRIV